MFNNSCKDACACSICEVVQLRMVPTGGRASREMSGLLGEAVLLWILSRVGKDVNH